MANETDIQTRTGTIVVGFSTSSTVSELVDGIRALRNKPEDNEERKSLIEAIKFVLKTFDIKINVLNWEEVTEFLKKFPENETIKKITEIKIEKTESPTSDLNKMKLNELVLAYEEANKINDSEAKSRIEKLIARYEKIELSQVEQFIKTQKELYKIDLEKLSASQEKKYIKQIQNVVKVDEIKAETILRETKIKIGKEVLEQKLEKVTALYTDPNIKKSIEDFVLGNTSTLGGLEGMELKNLELVVKKVIDENHDAIKYVKLGEIIDAFKAAEAKAPDDQKELVDRYGENFVKVFESKTPATETDMSKVGALMEANGVNPGTVKRASDDLKTLLNTIYTKPSELKNIYEDIKSLDMAGLQQKYLPNLPEVRSFQSLIRAIDADKGVMLGMQKMVHAKIEIVEGFGRFVSKFPGGEALVGKVSEQIGGIAIKKFLMGAMEVMAKEGMITGGKAVLEGFLVGTGATTGATGLSASAAAIAATVSALPPLAIVVIIALAVVAAVYVTYKIYDTVAGWVKSITGVNFLWGTRDTIAGWFGNGKFGKFVGTLGQFGFNAMLSLGAFGVMLFGPILGAGLAAMTAIIAPVVIGLTVGMMAYNLFITSPMISSLVPPPPMAAGGTCQPKEDLGTPAPSSGEINCNQNAPEANISISKEDFGKFADDWNQKIGGKNYARECFNDVVNRAKCAGIVPEYALWAWLHESGASNYSIANVEDFGIHGQESVPPKNFDKQITAFLKLDPATVCINDPRVGGNYWLAFSINYLLGDDPSDPNNSCNPDRADSNGNTGRKYEADLRDSWSRLGSPPSSIHSGSPGGQNCGGNKNNLVAEGENEFVAADGTVMVCSGPVDSQGNFIGIPGESKYDPNAPGLEGEKVEGECSVASKVRETKQCGQSWSGKSLPGGSGTICSAGCGPSSASSILRPINGSFTPDTVIFEDGSPFGNMTGDGSSLGQVKQSLAKHGITNTGDVGACSQKAIAEWICKGNAVVLLSDSDTGNGSTIGHILVAVAVSGGDIITKDPYYSNNKPFANKGAGNIRNLRECLRVQLGKD